MIYVWEWFACRCGNMCVRCWRRTEGGIRYPGTRIIVGRELSCECCVLREQQVLLISEPSLQPPTPGFKWETGMPRGRKTILSVCVLRQGPHTCVCLTAMCPVAKLRLGLPRKHHESWEFWLWFPGFVGNCFRIHHFKATRINKSVFNI